MADDIKAAAEHDGRTDHPKHWNKDHRHDENLLNEYADH
jgi:hypothetical protein